MDQDVWNREDGHLAQGARMAVAALVSAAMTAAVVIAIGQSVIDHRTRVAQPQAQTQGILIQTAG